MSLALASEANASAVLGVSTMPNEIIGWNFIKDRRTGHAVGPLTPVYAEDWPYQMPAREQRLWRYIDLWKFKSLIDKSALYFRRADKLPDVGEGKLSKEGVRGTLPSQIEFNAAYNIASQGWAVDSKAHEVTRSCMFINCWSIGETETIRMWHDYTTSADSLAISTTFDRLMRALGGENILVSRVKYVDETTPRAEFFHTTPFFYKDVSYSFENELRLLRPLRGNEEVLVNDEKDFGKMIKVDTALIIDAIVTHKNMSADSRKSLQKLLAARLPAAKLLDSAISP